MVSGPLHLPTATWGGHMGQFLLSVLILSSSTPLGNNDRGPRVATGARAQAPLPLRGRAAKVVGALPGLCGGCTGWRVWWVHCLPCVVGALPALCPTATNTCTHPRVHLAVGAAQAAQALSPEGGIPGIEP